MRCTYCVHGHKYHHERKHGELSINENIVYNAIDFCIKNTKVHEENRLTFYGGEPLLEIKKIYNTFLYATKKNIKHFFITTNGTLLNEENSDFLIRNDFNVTVSIDGPEKIHNLNRKFINNNETFLDICKKLNNIRSQNKDIYAEKFRFNCIITDFNNIDALNDFFMNDELFSGNKVRMSYLHGTTNLFDSNYNEKIVVESLDRSYKAIPPYLSQVADDIILIDKRSGKPRKCWPFRDKIYIRANGGVQFCEQLGNSFCLNEDICEVDNDNFFLNDIFKFHNEKCSACWANSVCNCCLSEAIDHCGNFSSNLLEFKCKSTMQYYKFIFSVFLSLKMRESVLFEGI